MHAYLCRFSLPSPSLSIHTYLYPLNAYANTKSPVIIHIATPHNTLCPPSTPSTLTPFPPLTAEAAAFPPPAVPPPELPASVELAGNVVVPVTVYPPPPPPFVVVYTLVGPIVVSFDPLLVVSVIDPGWTPLTPLPEVSGPVGLVEGMASVMEPAVVPPPPPPAPVSARTRPRRRSVVRDEIGSFIWMRELEVHVGRGYLFGL